MNRSTSSSPFTCYVHMQILGSVTARDRPRWGFKFKFPAAKVSAPVTGLTFPLAKGLCTCHPFCRQEYLSFEREDTEKEREIEPGKSLITHKRARTASHREIRNQRSIYGDQPSNHNQSILCTMGRFLLSFQFSLTLFLLFIFSSLILTRNNETVQTLVGINMHTCQRVSRAHHFFSVFHHRDSHTRAHTWCPLIPGYCPGPDWPRQIYPALYENQSVTRCVLRTVGPEK